MLTSTTGSIQTVGWPNVAYPLNAECQWDIVCPSNSIIEISLDNPFRLAGQQPACERSQLIVSECNGATVHGPFCHLTAPGDISTACNVAKVSFSAGSQRGGSRYGFKLNYRCVGGIPSTTLPPTTMATTRATTMAPTTRATTMAPTTAAPTLSPSCGGDSSVLTSSTGSIQTVGWPNVAYPLNIECQWNIVCPSNNRVRITFESNFRIAGQMPACDKDELRIDSITSNNDILLGRFCHTTAPGDITTDSNEVKVSFISRSGRGSSRTGFRLNYECFP